MRVFIVVTRFMGGVQDCGVFFTRDGAKHHATSLGAGGSPDVVECQVFGASVEQNEVFVGSTYDPSLDIHTVKGVYATYKEAKDAAGERGLVLTRKISA